MPLHPRPRVSAAAGRRKGAARPFGMGLRPTLPPTRCSEGGPVVGSRQGCVHRLPRPLPVEAVTGSGLKVEGDAELRHHVVLESPKGGLRAISDSGRLRRRVSGSVYRSAATARGTHACPPGSPRPTRPHLSGEPPHGAGRHVGRCGGASAGAAAPYGVARYTSPGLVPPTRLGG